MHITYKQHIYCILISEAPNEQLCLRLHFETYNLKSHMICYSFIAHIFSSKTTWILGIANKKQTISKIMDISLTQPQLLNQHFLVQNVLWKLSSDFVCMGFWVTTAEWRLHRRRWYCFVSPYTLLLSLSRYNFCWFDKYLFIQ